MKRLDKHMKAKHGQLNEEKRHAAFKDLMLNQYTEWMNSRDSGMDREQTRVNHLSKVKIVLGSVFAKSLEDVLDEKKILDVIDYHTHANLWSASSARTYLFSLVNFYTFLKTNYFRSWLETKTKLLTNYSVKLVTDKASRMRESCLRWTKGMKSEANRDSEAKYDYEQDQVLTGEERRVLKHGRHTKEIKALIEKNEE